MIVTHKILTDVMVALRENEKMMRRDNWLLMLVAAWKTRLYTHYDFGSGLDFHIQQLKKGLTSFGPVSEKVSAGNDTGMQEVDWERQ
jgi:hypothetical protein